MDKIAQDIASCTVTVIFRMDPPSEGGECFALLPEEVDDLTGYVTCFTVWGHTRANYYLCIQNSRPARSDEYAELANEMRRRGYILRIRQRRPRIV